MRTRACEFPCDNEALHQGSSWIQEEHGKALVNLLATEASVLLAVDVAPFAVGASTREELDLTPVTSMVGVCGEVLEGEPETIDLCEEESPALAELPQATVEHRPSGIQLRDPADMLEPEEAISVEDLPFDAFVFSPDEIAGGAEVNTELEASSPPLPSSAFFERIRTVVRGSGGELAVAALDQALSQPDTFLAQRLDAWKKLLDFECDDISACGGQTLDEFAATLAATALGAPERHPELRKSLRAIGIAAFGLLDAA